MVLLKELGDAMRQGRKKQGLTQEQFAERCGISTREVSNIENAKSEPKFGTLIRICRTCGISIEKFISKSYEEGK